MKLLTKLFPLHDIRSQLIFWMVIVTVVPLFVLNLSLFYYNYIPLLESFAEFNNRLLYGRLLTEQNSEASQLADRIDYFLKDLKMQGLMIGRSVLFPFLTDTEKNRILQRFLRAFPDIDYIVIRDVEDHVRSAAREGRTYSAQLQSILADQTMFQMTLAGEVSFSQPFIVDGTQELAMVMSLPILSESGRPLGALLLQIDLARIQELTEHADEIDPGIIYVIDSEGILIGHVDRSRVLKREDMKDLEIVQSYLIPRTASGSIPYLDKEGREVQGAFALVEDLNWGVVTERLKSTAFREVDEMQKQARQTIQRMGLSTLIGVLSMVILAVGMGALLAVRITSPVRDMARGANEIAKGDFSRRFDETGASEIKQLASTLNQMSQSIELHVKELKELFKGSVESLTAAIDAKDPYTRGHSRRVTLISLMLGEKLRLSQEQLNELEISALMHDIGKIGIDDAILKKPSVVTKDELKILQTHPELGASIMRPIPMLTNMIPGMLHHHERWDGSGYPDHLKALDIPLYGRIIAVADTFDAMTSDRPYQKTYSFDEARSLIDSWGGTRYDPEIIQAFLQVFAPVCEMIRKMRI
jgi:HD-GYP domain-containing protein (c-di-GMP phosphodiesterase class II)